MPQSTNLRPIGTVKMVARGESLLAPTSVTLFCATRSGLPGDPSANSMCLRSWCEDSLYRPHVHVAGVQRPCADNLYGRLESELVVALEVHLRERGDNRIEEQRRALERRA